MAQSFISTAISKIKKVASSMGKNLSDWKQVATQPQLRQDYVQQVIQPRVQQAVSNLQLPSSNLWKNVSQSPYFNPTTLAKPKLVSPIKQYTQPQNFWTSKAGLALGKAQEFIESPQAIRPFPTLFKVTPEMSGLEQFKRGLYNLPTEIGNTIIGQGILDPMSDIGQSLGRNIGGRELADYKNLKSGVGRLGQQLGGVAPVTPKEVIGNLADVAIPIATAYVPKGLKVIAGVTKPTLMLTIKGGAKMGAKMGGGFGFLEGLSSGREIKDNTAYFENLAINTGLGVGFGTFLGALTSAGGYGFQKIVSAVKRVFPKATEKESRLIAGRFLQDETGRFMGSTKKEPKTYGDLREELGLPRHGYKPEDIPFGFSVKPKGGQQAVREAEKVAQGGLSDIKATKGVGGAVEGGASSPMESYKDLNRSVAQISKPVLKKQLKNVLSTQPKTNVAVSSESIIPQKGKLNIGRLKVKGAGKEVLKEIESGVKPTIIGNKEVIDMARTAKGTKGMSDEVMKKLLAQQLKNRQKVVDLTARFNKAKAEGASETELAKIMLDMANQSKVAREGGTFAGRLLQAQNIIADESASPMQKIFALLDNAGIEPEKYLRDSVKVNWDNPMEVVSFYRKYVPPQFGEVLTEIRYSNMLSSPLTHIINTASNFLQTGVIAPIEKTITGTLDWGKSLLTGKERQYYANAGIKYAGGYLKSLPQAFKKASKILSGEETLMKPDYERIPLGNKGFLKAYSTPLRALEAMDQFFKTLVGGGVTRELKGRLSTAEIALKAEQEGNYRLFRQAFDPNGELGQGIVLKTFDKWNTAIANLRRVPGGKWILPFFQTPTNILKQGLEYSPLGFSTMVGAKEPIAQLSKAIIGTGVFIGAYQLAKNGLTSWESPSSESERDLYYAAGMQPYSIKIGNKWVSFSKLGPLSYPIAMAAALADAEKKNPDQAQVNNISKSISGILGFFGDQSYVKSIGDLVDAVQGGINIGPTAITAEAANLAGQLIPYKSFLTWLGRITDPVYRKANTFKERMVKDLPIIGRNLEPYTNLEGQPSVRDYPLLNAISPYKVTQEKAPEAQMLNQYQTQKISNQVQKRIDEEFLAGNQDYAVSGRTYRYVKDGSLKKIDVGKVFNMPENTEYERLAKEKKAYTLVDEILENLPEDKQAEALTQLGITAEDATYYNVARQENDLKTAWINDQISQIDSKDRTKLINFLVEQRKVINGKMILADGVLTQLVDDGIISKSEQTMLKNLKIIDGKAKTKITGRGKKATLKKVSLPKSTKIKAPKIKTMAELLPKSTKIRVKKYNFRSKL